jgi:hypothetical protein
MTRRTQLRPTGLVGRFGPNVRFCRDERVPELVRLQAASAINLFSGGQ